MLEHLEGPVGAYAGFDVGLATNRLQIMFFEIQGSFKLIFRRSTESVWLQTEVTQQHRQQISHNSNV